MQIIITMGPKCCTSDVIGALIDLGIRGIRFPFSKESPRWQIEKSFVAYEVASKRGIEIDIIMDLPGSQPRTVNPEPVQVEEGQRIELLLSASPPTTGALSISVTMGNRFQGCKERDTILVGDGELGFEVMTVLASSLVVKSLRSGVLTQRRGLTLQNRPEFVKYDSPDDESMLKAFSQGAFNKMFLSFVGSRMDLEAFDTSASEWLGDRFRSEMVMPKIETLAGVQHLDQILEKVNCIVLGRGDLALQVGSDELYAAQCRVFSSCRTKKKTVIIGTQLLESASHSLVPHRSEVIEICRLLEDGVGGFLLSAETTIGNPIRTVSMLQRLINRYGVAT